MKAAFIAAFEQDGPAASLRDRFERAGIKARVKDDSLLQSLVYWTKPAAAQKVYVEADNFRRACDYLEEWERNERVLADAIRCPECGSPRVQYPQYTRKFATPLLIEWLISLGAADKMYYCTECQYTWPRTPKAPADLDVLGFPKRRR